MTGMLPGDTPHYGPWPDRTSPGLRWSVMAVKPAGSRKIGSIAPLQNFWQKNLKTDIKTPFCDVMSEVQMIHKAFLQEWINFKKVWHTRIFSGICRQSWRSQLWPRPVELGCIQIHTRCTYINIQIYIFLVPLASTGKVNQFCVPREGTLIHSVHSTKAAIWICDNYFLNSLL